VTSCSGCGPPSETLADPDAAGSPAALRGAVSGARRGVTGRRQGNMAAFAVKLHCPVQAGGCAVLGWKPRPLGDGASRTPGAGPQWLWCSRAAGWGCGGACASGGSRGGGRVRVGLLPAAWAHGVTGGEAERLLGPGGCRELGRAEPRGCLGQGCLTSCSECQPTAALWHSGSGKGWVCAGSLGCARTDSTSRVPLTAQPSAAGSRVTQQHQCQVPGSRRLPGPGCVGAQPPGTGTAGTPWHSLPAQGQPACQGLLAACRGGEPLSAPGLQTPHRDGQWLPGPQAMRWPGVSLPQRGLCQALPWAARGWAGSAEEPQHPCHGRQGLPALLPSHHPQRTRTTASAGLLAARQCRRRRGGLLHSSTLMGSGRAAPGQCGGCGSSPSRRLRWPPGFLERAQSCSPAGWGVGRRECWSLLTVRAPPASRPHAGLCPGTWQQSWPPSCCAGRVPSGSGQWEHCVSQRPRGTARRHVPAGPWPLQPR